MSRFLDKIDHLVYAVTDLEVGMREMQKLFGVAPALGGHHPDFGTHNALLGLGDKTYLEVIAINTSLPCPDRGWPFGLSANQESRLQTWALKLELSQPSLLTSLFGNVSDGSRLTKSGKLLSWKLTDPWLMPFDGVLPFLIDWGDTEHPAVDLPQVGVVDNIRVNHPGAGEVRAVMDAMDLDNDFIQYGESVGIIAEIRQEDGKIITLK